MQVLSTELPDVKRVRLHRHVDDRGWFVETWREDLTGMLGIDAAFVQDNGAWSARAGTVRGLHYQLPPAAQGKLVRVVRGAIWDVAVDLRPGSPTEGRWVAVALDARTPEHLWIPPGFAHGYCTLEDDTEVAYKVTAFHAPDLERGVAWDDPFLAIRWPVTPERVVMSTRDRALPHWASRAAGIPPREPVR
jgi:dTDP-4-dehydrorhamnose 3,5-epimerase